MSGNPTSNVVPMVKAPAPATAPPQMPTPFPMWGGGGTLPWGPGCCPPGGMDALMKCYCDVQAATAFICSVMVQCIQTNPAVTAAIIAAIEASGSSLPLIGVTDGSNAQPGQVGEFIQYNQAVPYTATQTVTNVSMGVLPPGDWDLQSFGLPSTVMSVVAFALTPVPTGFTSQLGCYDEIVVAGEATTVIGEPCRASITVPTLLAFGLTLQGNATSGTLDVYIYARRRR